MVSGADDPVGQVEGRMSEELVSDSVEREGLREEIAALVWGAQWYAPWPEVVDDPRFGAPVAAARAAADRILALLRR